jgi:hypothetical protein
MRKIGMKVGHVMFISQAALGTTGLPAESFQNNYESYAASRKLHKKISQKRFICRTFSEKAAET